jgi:hypothetical protein
MIPYGVPGQPLGVFLTEDFSVSGELHWYSMDWLGWDGSWVEQHPSNKILRGAPSPWYVPLPRKESGPFCIPCMYDNW